MFCSADSVPLDYDGYVNNRLSAASYRGAILSKPVSIFPAGVELINFLVEVESMKIRLQ